MLLKKGGLNLIHAVMALALAAAGWLILAPLRKRDIWTWRIAASGFIIRAVAATALFLVSITDVPGFRGLHNDAGIWFFAPDGRKYLSLANAVADGTAGLPAALGQTRRRVSSAY